MTYEPEGRSAPPLTPRSEALGRAAATAAGRVVRGGQTHAVQFYEDDAFLIESVCRFIGTGLAAGGAGVLIIDRRHREPLCDALRARGADVDALTSRGTVVMLDAAETLSQIMVDGLPDKSRFVAVVGEVLTRAAAASAQGDVRAFGEMVALLYADGRAEAAIQLEKLWNDLASTTPFTLLCAYPLSACSAAGDPSFLRVCAEHSEVVPAETFPVHAQRGEQLRAVAQLQQRASALSRAMGDLGEQLGEIERQRDEYLAMLGHELRNPLEPIVHAVDILKHFSSADPLLIEARDVIDRQVGHMARLVEDLLDVARMTNGTIGLRVAPVALAECLATAVETARTLIEQRGHHFDIAMPAEPIWIRGDAARLIQIFGNLLTNAAKFTAPGGHISLSAERVDGVATVHVRDTGMGIDPVGLERIFDPFVQYDTTLDRSNGGLGIGLTLARRLVELHGGGVWARSDGRGMGSEFIVRLPALTDAPPLSDVAEARPARVPATPLAILVVEDNVDAAESLMALLELHGHTVRTAHDGAAALAIVGAGFRPDVAIVDLGLPGMNGFELASALRGHPACGETSLLALSGYGADEDKRRARAAGFDHHLIKPIDLTTLRELLASRQGRDAGAASGCPG